MPIKNCSTRQGAGYVYVLSNSFMPGLVKIGQSANGAYARAKQLSNTSTPTTFRVEFEVMCADASRVESRVHRSIKGYRVSRSREFFRLPILAAIGYVIDAARSDWANLEPRPMTPEFRVERLDEDEMRKRHESGLRHLRELKARLAEDGENHG